MAARFGCTEKVYFFEIKIKNGLVISLAYSILDLRTFYTCKFVFSDEDKKEVGKIVKEYGSPIQFYRILIG